VIGGGKKIGLNQAKIGRSVLAVAVLAITASWPGGDPSGTAGKALPSRRRAQWCHMGWPCPPSAAVGEFNSVDDGSSTQRTDVLVSPLAPLNSFNAGEAATPLQCAGLTPHVGGVAPSATACEDAMRPPLEFSDLLGGHREDMRTYVRTVRTHYHMEGMNGRNSAREQDHSTERARESKSREFICHATHECMGPVISSRLARNKAKAQPTVYVQQHRSSGSIE
jgi:hypothetical protein